MPPTSVYLVWPCSIARLAASLMRLGVSKSGSPAPKEITSIPWARMALALACMASVGDGASVFRRSASIGDLLSREFLSEPGLDGGRHQAGDGGAEGGHFLDEARGDVRVPLVGHHEHRLHRLAELPVHQRHLELVLEVRDGTQPAHDAIRLLALDEVDSEAVERGDAHAVHARRALVDELEALLDREQRRLGRVGDDGDDELVEDAEAPLDEVQVSVVHRIEHPGIHGALAHEVPRWIVGSGCRTSPVYRAA